MNIGLPDSKKQIKNIKENNGNNIINREKEIIKSYILWKLLFFKKLFNLFNKNIFISIKNLRIFFVSMIYNFTDRGVVNYNIF